MAQSMNNTVKWGLNLNPKPITPSYTTQTSTPAFGNLKPNTNGGGSWGGSPYENFTRYTPPVNNTTPPVSTNTPQFNSSGGGLNQQLDSIKSQALNIQDLLNQKKEAEKNQTQQRTLNKKTAPITPTQPTGLFPGILQSLLGMSQPTAEQERARKEMERIAAGNQAIGDEAARISRQYGDEISRVGGLKAGAVAGNLSTGTNVVGSGNANLASVAATTRMQALADAQDAALKGTAQQLTGQEQQAQAFNPSLQATLTQQQQGITGLSNAANYAAPVQVQPGSTLYGPDAGNMVAGGLGGWAEYTTAQQAQSLMEQYPDAGVQYNPSLSAQQNLQQIQSALGQSPTYQRGTFGAAGAGSYIGGQQLGAAGDLTKEVAKYQTMGNAADTNFSLMLDIMNRGGVNNLDQPVLNQLQQGLARGLTSNADVVAFRSALQTVRSQYAAILGGGNPTDATLAMASEKIPDTVSLGALKEVEKTMKTMVDNTVASYNQQISAYSQNNTGGQDGNPFATQW